jgi:putative ABC transport system ATP-binding protein
MALIEVKDLEKTYSDGTQAVRGVSFDVQDGEFAAIMGPSGSGKSTLLHILGFLDKPTKGQYRYEGRIMNDYSSAELAHIRNKKFGFVFQMFNLLPRISVLENVKIPLLYSGVNEKLWEERAGKVIDSLGLSHRVKYEPAKLSGGERQRVAMARALVNNPQVIFADEPTGNLDSKSGQAVMDILHRLHEEGHTVILITHETYTAEHAERIIHIHDGKIDSDARVGSRKKLHSHFIK